MDKLVIEGGTRSRAKSSSRVRRTRRCRFSARACSPPSRASRKRARPAGRAHDAQAARPDGRADRKSGDGRVTLNASKVDNLVAPYEMVKTMRASILVLGPLVARFGQANVSLPGGCAIGARPVDQHIKGLQAMGAEITIEHGFIEARAKRLKGARIVTDMITVTGTENLLMAAVLAEGETVIENAAREPEVERSRASAREDGREDRRHRHGPARDPGRRQAAWRAAIRSIPDRIEAGTFLCAVAAAGGDVTLAPRASADSRSGDREAARSRRDDRGRRQLDARAHGRSVPNAVSVPHVRIPGVPDRHAGAVHGAELDREGHVAGRRDDLREPLHARAGTEPPRRAASRSTATPRS